jgi:hypothetical protein
VSGYLREVGTRPAHTERDPMGKAALFSDTRRPGTVVVECNSCGASTRLTYVDFALSTLPFSLWLPPIPQIHFNRRMTCPSCAEGTWVRAHWLA